ncbi:MAG: ESPR-type extended signal peptide-containing protein [Phascolarctobacterium sp.]|uniref:ESPR-type extended signal peptide-containing protein n=1 Tax=Phascolarctobacterium sp. TaxID=2049039 RepID=UPI0026DAEE98|nr:ESPR-type extended signal peptide-containing protein [Phascolarctobacterium sp.]MDO4921286.1 ESPR-type extended signal peptide-containing protein [Phascolarctobacterium sp.]
MNKIFKVVWNKARGCYVVASEFAKSRTKSGRAAKAAAVAVAAALTLGMNGLALAANGAGTEYSEDYSATATHKTDIAVGNDAKAGEKIYQYENGKDCPDVGKSTAVGDGAVAEDYRSTAIGSGAYASGALYTNHTESGDKIFYGASTAVGSNAKATNHGSTALGSGVQALGEAWTVTVGEGADKKTYVYKGVSTAIGHGSVARMYASIAIGDEGTAYGARSIAMGSHAQTGLPIKADGSGYKNEELQAANVDGIAIGTDTVSSGRAATALGARSDASGEAGTATGASSIAQGRFSAAYGAESKAYGENGVAIGNGAQTGLTKKVDREAYTDEELKTLEPQEGGTAVGTDAEASGRAATALGARSTASAEGSTSLGASSAAQGTNSTALGVESKATGIRSTTVGYKSTASKANSTALGYYSQATGYASTAVGTAIDEKDFFTKASGERSTALGASAQATERASTATGANSHANGVASAAFGYKSIADKNYALAAGYEAHAYAESSVAIGSYATASTASNVALGALSNDSAGTLGYKQNTTGLAFSDSNGNNYVEISKFAGTGTNVIGTVSVGYGDSKRTLTNVAAGLISSTSTDAINGSQLYYAYQGLQDQINTINTKIDGSTGGGTNQDHTVNGNDNKKPNDTTNYGDKPSINSGAWTTDGNLLIRGDEDTNGNTSYDISLNPDLDLNSVTFNKTVVNEDGVKFDENHYVTKNEIMMGNTVINDNSVKVGDITVNENNIDMGGNKIINVAPGTEDTDAVNYSQLKELNQNIENNSVQINKLKGRIDKVGAGAAALAALHPLDFDPDDKFYLSAGYGNYRGENAVAVGAFYQPNDDTLFSVSSTVGNDDDMINAGVTWRFGQSSHQSRSKKAMAKEIIELRTRLASLEAMIYSMAGAGLDPEKSKLFPDTPENHWAYDYVAVVAGNGILEGYPNGQFDGSRPMTRYEMAAVVYRLLQKGVQVDNRMIQEFAPELARVRVDTLTHYNDGTPHIQRVRVIKDRG